MILKKLILGILPELACSFDFLLSSSQRREIKSVVSSIVSNREKYTGFVV